MKTIILATVVAMAPIAALADWAGPYGGVYLGYENGDAEDVTFGPGAFDIDGAAFGAFGGYNFQRGAVVYGGEIDLKVGGVSGDDGAFQLPYEITGTAAIDFRVGYDAGAYLPYLTLGVVQAGYKSDHEGSDNPADFAEGTMGGYSFGIGMDWQLTDTGFMRFEVLHTKYGATTFDYYGGDLHDMAKTSVTSISFGYAMTF